MTPNTRNAFVLPRALNCAALAVATLMSVSAVHEACSDGPPVDIQNPNVVAGQATWIPGANAWIINAGHRAIIEYGAFNIGAGGAVQFIQPGANAVVLNRIIGSNPSTINGALSSNGILYFVNPAGIMFGPNAVLNVGGLYAAAGSLSNTDFLGGVNRFTDLHGAVTNEGTIQAGGVALLGQHVANRGTILTPNGFTTFAAADRVLLAPDNSGLIVMVERDQPAGNQAAPGSAEALASEAAIENTGTVNAAGGNFTAAAGDFYSMAMNLEGTIVASEIVAQGGQDGVVAVNGTLNANGAANGSNTGGNIEVTGEYVLLDSAARLLATGKNGGGEILVGGDFQGSNPDVQNAFRTHVARGALLDASATYWGNGGKVIIWSNDLTNYAGSIKATGAGPWARGGFVEVSGKRMLGFVGDVNLRGGIAGRSGTLLLDPTDITITDATTDVFVTEAAGTFSASGANNSGNLGVDAINAVLATGNVIVTTVNAAGAGAGDITWNATAAIADGGAGNSLTLQAENDITFAAAVGFGTWTGSLIAQAANSITVNAIMDRTGAAGGIDLLADFDGSGVGSVAVNAAITTAGGSVTIRGADYVGGAVAINAGAGDVFLQGSTTGASYTVGAGAAGFGVSDAELDQITAATVNIGRIDATGGSLTLDGGVTYAGGDLGLIGYSTVVNFGIDLGNGASLAIGATNDAAGSLTFGAGVNIDADTTSLQIAGNSATIIYNAATLFRDDAGAANPTSLSVETSSGAAGSLSSFLPGAGNFFNAADLSGVTLSFENTGAGTLSNDIGNLPNADVSITTAGAVDANSSGVATNYNSYSITTNGFDVTQTNDIDLVANLVVSSMAGDITLSNAGNTFGNVVFVGGNNVILQADAGGIELGVSSAATDFTLTSAGNVIQSGVLSVTGLTNINAAGNDVTLGSANLLNGAVAVQGVNVTLNNGGPTDLAASTITGAFVLTSTGEVTQSGALSVTSTTEVLAGLANITLTNAGNTFGTTVTLTGGDVQVRDSGALELGNVTASGLLGVQSSGAITQAAGTDLGVVTTASFTSNGGAVTLDSVTNSFGGGVTINSTGAGAGGAVILDGSGGAALSVTSINSSGTAGGAAGAVTLRNNNAVGTLSIGAINATGGSLGAGAGGDGGAITLNAVSGITVAAGGSIQASGGNAGAASGANGGNGGLVTFNNATQLDNNVSFTSLGGAGDGAGLAGLAANFVFVDTTALNGISSFAGATVGFNLATTLLSNSQVTTTGGNIVFSNTLDGTAGGAAETLQLTAGTSDITFTMAVGGVDPLGAVTVVSAGNVTSTSSFTAASFTQNAGTGTTDFQGQVTTTGIFDVSTAALTMSSAAVNNIGGDFWVTVTGAFDLASLSVGGSMDVTSSGAITQAASIAVTGTSGFVSAGGAVTLNNAGNSFGGGVTINTTDIGAGGAVILDGSGGAALVVTSINTSGTIGGNAGAVTVTNNNAAGTLTLGTILAEGGLGAGLDGGAGADINLTATSLITAGIGANISADGGAAAVGSGANGGNAGDINFLSAAFVDPGANLSVLGGAGDAPGVDGLDGTISFGVVTLNGTSSYFGNTGFGAVTLLADSTVSVDGTLTFGGAVTGGGFDLAVTVQDVVISAAFSNVDVFTLIGFDGNEQIGVGNAFGGAFVADIDLTNAEVVFLNNAGAGINTLVLGDAGFNGDLAIAAGTTLPFALEMNQDVAGSADIFLGTWSDGTGAGNITVQGDVVISGSGDTALMAGTNSAMTWNIADAIQVNGDAILVSTVGGVTINNTGFAIYGNGGDRDLTIRAPNGQSVTITADGFGDNGGANAFIDDLTIEASSGAITASLRLGGTIVGVMDVNANTAINLEATGAGFTANAGMHFDDAVTLTAATTLVTDGGVGSNIAFDSTITGTFALVVNTGVGGSTIFSGDVGTAADLESLTATGTVVLEGVDVDTTGAVLFNSGVNLTTGASDIDAGTTLTFGGAVSGGQAFDVSGVTSVTFNADVGTTPLASLVVNGATNIAADVDFDTVGNATFNGAITLAGGAVTIATGAGGGIDFNSTITGAAALDLAGGAGGVVFGGTVGTAALTSLNVTGAATIEGINITTTGAIDFNNAVSVTTNNVIVTSGGLITLDQTLDATGAFAVTLDGNGGVTVIGATTDFSAVTFDGTGGNVAAGSITNVTGAIALTGTTVNLNGTDYASTAGSVTVTGAAVLGNNVSVSSGGAVGDDITFTSTINADNAGAFDRTLTLDSGGAEVAPEGNISVAGAVGAVQALAGLQVTDSDDATFSSTVRVTDGAGTVVIADTEAGNLITFTGLLTAGSLNAQQSNSAYNLSLLGGATITDTTTFSNGGTVTLGLGNDAFDFQGGLTATLPSTVFLDGTITTDDAGVTIGTLNLDGNSGINTLDAAGGAIAITTIDGDAFDLTLVSAGATTTVSGVATDIDALTLQENAATSTGAVTFQGNLDATSLTTFARAYNVSLLGTTTTITNATTFNNSGNLTLGGAGDTVTFTNGLTATAANLLTVGGTLNTTGTPMTLGAVTLNASTTFDTGNAANATMSIGAITSAGNAVAFKTLGADSTMTVGAVADISGGLTLTDAGGLASFGALGGGVSGAITVLNGQGGVNFTGAVNATTVTLADMADGQDIHFQANLTAITLTTAAQGYDLLLTGGTTTITNAVNFLNTGVVTLGNAAGDTLNFNGGLAFGGNAASNLAGTITSPDQTINFGTGGATLTAATTVDTNGSALTFGGTIVGGGNNLTLVSQDAAITVVGAATGLGDVTLQENLVTSTGDVTFQGQLTANDLITFNRAYSLSLLGTGNDITQQVDFNIAAGETLTLGDAAADTFLFDGGFDVVNDAAVQTSATITTSGDLADFGAGGTTLTGALDVDTNGGNIVFGSTIAGGGFALTLESNAGDITVTGTVGAAADLGAITIDAANNATFGSTVDAASFTQSAGTGTTRFTGLFDMSGAFAFTGSNLTVDGAGNNEAGTAMTVTNAGLFTTADAANLVVGNEFAQNGAGNSLIGGNITSTADGIDFDTQVTLQGADEVVLTSAGGAGDDIELGSNAGTDVLGAAQALTLNAGADGNITVNGDVGAVGGFLGGLLVLNAANAAFNQDVRAASYTQAAGTGTTTFAAAGLIELTNAFAFIGTNLTIDGVGNNSIGASMEVTNSGLFTTADGANLVVVNEFAQDGAGNSLIGGNITSTDDGIDFDTQVTLQGADAVVLTSGGGAGDDIVLGTNAGTDVLGNAQPLTLNAGADGNITVNGDVGAVGAFLGALRVTNAANADFNQTVRAANFNQDAGTGTTTFQGLFDLTTTFAFTGNNLTVNGAGNNQVGTGMTVSNAGTFTTADAAALVVGNEFLQNGAGNNVIGGNISSTNDGIDFDTQVTLQGADVVVMTSSGGAGDDIVLGTNAGTDVLGNGQALTLDAGAAGDITVNGDMGAVGAFLGAINVTNAEDATFNQTVRAASFTQVAGAVTGTTTFNGLFDLTTVFAFTGQNLTVNGAGNNAVGTTMEVTNAGLFTTADTANLVVGNEFAQNGAGNSLIGGNIDSTNDGIDFDTQVTLQGADAVVMTTGGGAGDDIVLGSNAGTDVLGNGQALTLNAGALGNITVNGDMGAVGASLGDVSVTNAANADFNETVRAASFTQAAGTGTTTFQDLFVMTNGFDFTGSNLTINGVGNNSVGTEMEVTNGGLFTTADTANLIVGDDFVQNGVGSSLIGGDITSATDGIDFDTQVTLQGADAVVMTTGGDVGDDIFLGTDATTDVLGNGQALTLNAGADGDITVNGDMGAVGAFLGAINVTNAENADFNQNVRAASFTQAAGAATGTTTFAAAGLIDLTGAFAFTGQNLTVNGVGNNTVGTTMTVTNAGLFTTAATANLTVTAGPFVQNGAGGNSLGGDITSGDLISFLRVVTLTDAVTMISGGLIGEDITFNSSLDGTVAGAQTLDLTAGAGNIDFNGVVGGTRLGAVTVTSAANVTADLAFTAASFTQVAGTGTTQFDGAVDLDTATGFDIQQQNAVVLNASLTTTNGGVVNIDATNTVDIAAAGDIFADGAVTIDANGGGADAIQTAGDVTTTGDIVTFGDGTTLTDSVTIATADGTVTFNSTLDGTAGGASEGLTLTAVAGNIDFNGVVGGNERLGEVLVNSALDVTADLSFTATGFRQLAAGVGGTTTFDGLFDLSVAFNFTGNNLTVNGAGNNQVGLGMTLMNGGLFETADAANLVVGTEFLQLGAGANLIGGNVRSVNTLVTFSSQVTLQGADAVVVSTGGFAGSNIRFASGIDGAGQDLTLNAGADGNITVVGAVGAALAELGDVVVTNGNMVAFTSTVDAASFTQQASGIAGVTTFSDLFTLSGAFSFDGNILNVNGVGTNSVGAGMTVTNADVFTTAVGADLDVTGSFNQNGAGANSLGGDLTTSAAGADLGNIDLDGAITLTNDVIVRSNSGNITFEGTVDGGFDFSADAEIDITFNDDIGNTVALDTLTVTSNFVNTVAFGANVDVVHAVGDITFNNAAAAVAPVPTVATITSEHTTGITFTSDAGNFSMGNLGQKLTSFGTLTISAAAGTASLGDLVAVGDINVTATAINFFSRSAGNVTQVNGTTLPDVSVDVVAGGLFRFSVTPTMNPNPSTPLVRFASSLVDADVNGTLIGSYIVRRLPYLVDGSLLRLGSDPSIILDLRAEGVPAINSADLGALAGAVMPMMAQRPSLLAGDADSDSESDSGEAPVEDEKKKEEASAKGDDGTSRAGF